MTQFIEVPPYKTLIYANTYVKQGFKFIKIWSPQNENKTLI